MIIDCHCHAGKGDRMTAPWNTEAAIEPYLRRARAAGIAKTVVVATFHSDYAKANADVARIIARYPDRLIGFVFVHASRDAGRIFSMVAHALHRWHFRGIKIHGYEAMPTREVCEAARRFRVPIFVDVVSRPEVIDMLAPQYPDVNFIVAHLGSYTDDWRAHQQVVYQVARYPNVYADTSAVRRFDYIVEAIKRAGPRKLLFGSDGPWIHPGVELHKIRMLGLPKEQSKLVLGGNVMRLMRHAHVGEAASHVARSEKYSGDGEPELFEASAPRLLSPDPAASASDFNEYRL
ncbi:amidohydrolase family protein [Acidicapsa acidisoli]|uniref:amidohydrolase family protein n=1 Tax=Acidicapsa acidisoli TaxID=1615681 RepID=UPI0021DF65FD|nr:amidohydrolase family protein [Acidicapsa acidisoli]